MFDLDIEAEVRYAVRHEYAQTAVDFIARRSRLAFLNAQASVDALPRVIDIMGDELKWSRSRRDAEFRRAVSFLQQSMGLLGGSDMTSPPQTWTSWIRETVLMARPKPMTADVGMYSRSQFEPGELDTLKIAFTTRALEVKKEGDQSSEQRLAKKEVPSLLSSVPGYEDTKEREFYYILDEAGFASREFLDFDEFVEVCHSRSESESL